MPRLSEKMFYNGRVIPVARHLIPGRIRQPGVFETMLFDRGVIFFWERHLRRLRAGWARLKFSALNFRFRPVVRELIRLNRFDTARVRLMAWREKGRPHLAVTVSPWTGYSLSRYQQGFRLGLAEVRLDPAEHPASLKAMAYAPYARVSKAARAWNKDDAVLLNVRGEVVETSRANIFFVKGRELMTPGLTCGCLNGITRRIMIGLARQNGLTCRSVKLAAEDLFSMDEIFVTNSLLGIMPVNAVQGRRIGRPRRRPVTRSLARAYGGFCRAYRSRFKKL